MNISKRKYLFELEYGRKIRGRRISIFILKKIMIKSNKKS
jgi:hypothetical protein